MSDKILIANARESWLQACIYSNLILHGYVTLQYKKMFVSTLHNSVELLMKQRMLDLNDYRIVKIRKKLILMASRQSLFILQQI